MGSRLLVEKSLTNPPVKIGKLRGSVRDSQLPSQTEDATMDGRHYKNPPDIPYKSPSETPKKPGPTARLMQAIRDRYGDDVFQQKAKPKRRKKRAAP